LLHVGAEHFCDSADWHLVECQSTNFSSRKLLCNKKIESLALMDFLTQALALTLALALIGKALRKCTQNTFLSIEENVLDANTGKQLSWAATDV
jgi:hypothetical protein